MQKPLDTAISPGASTGNANQSVRSGFFPPPSSGEVHLRGRITRILWVACQIFLSYFLYECTSLFASRNRKTEWREHIHQKNALRLQQAALSLKGLLIKVCQFISARVDLLPEAYTKTLSLLQDKVPPAPYQEIRARIIEELGSPPEVIFRVFHESPVAAASLGQVHEAILMEAEQNGFTADMRVAVKVQYPGIESVVETDLRAIRLIVWGLQKIFPNIRFDMLYEEFSKIVHHEMNYIIEGRQAEQFHKNFSEDDRIVVPLVVWKHTTQRVLTLQFVDGIKISRVDEIGRAGIDTKQVATLLAESYMKQILQHRFFHGDPHPGNLFVQPGPRLVFVDFGLMQQIDPAMHLGMKKMIMAIIDRDIPDITQALFDLGFIARSEKTEDIAKIVHFFMERYRDISPRALKRITIMQIAEDLATLFHLHPALQLPNHFILVGRTVGMLNGLCSQLDPDLNIIELAKPYAQAFVKDGQSPIFSKGKEIVSALLELPAALRSLVELTSKGQFQTQMHSEDLTAILTKIYRLAYRTVLAATIFVLFFLYHDISFPPIEAGGDPAKVLLGTLIALSGIAFLFSFSRRR